MILWLSLAKYLAHDYIHMLPEFCSIYSQAHLDHRVPFLGSSCWSHSYDESSCLPLFVASFVSPMLHSLYSRVFLVWSHAILMIATSCVYKARINAFTVPSFYLATTHSPFSATVFLSRNISHVFVKSISTCCYNRSFLLLPCLCLLLAGRSRSVLAC